MREMKNSGIPTFGYVPKSWKICKLKSLLTLKSEKNSGDRELLSVYLDKGVISYSDSTGLQVHKPSVDLSNYQNVSPGDFVLNNQQAWRGSVGVSKYHGIISPAYFVYGMNSQCHPLYMNYLLRDTSMVQQYETSSRGVGTIQRNIFAPWLLQCQIVLPPLPEQKAIATYLDAKCAEIDALTADIQAQIDTLEQYKQSVITEAVTKGLNHDVKMKDSGIQWIGNIPSHWNVHPVYNYFTERKHKNSLGNETNLLSLSYGKVIRKDINTNEGLLPESFSTYNIVESADIIIRPTDLQNDKRSLRTGLVTEHGIITSAYIALSPSKEVDSRYFHYLLHSYDIMKVFYNLGNGVRQGLNYSEFSHLMVFEPPICEQTQIANYLDTKVSEIDSIIHQKQDQLETLESYKKSLIYEYVTGKKEVPTAKPDVISVILDPEIVLSYITYKLGEYNEKGKVYSHKVKYLVDYHTGLGLNIVYTRNYRGPHDVNLDAYIDAIISKGWYRKQNKNGTEILVKGKNYTDFINNHLDIFNHYEIDIDNLIKYLKTLTRGQIERIATLYAAWNDFIIDGKTNPTEEEIITEVVTNWTKNKANYQHSTWLESLNQMKQHSIIPKGQGLHTIVKS